MLLYLSGHSRPDVTYRVSQVKQFTFWPRQSHERALKIIGRYLFQTHQKGLVLAPTPKLSIDTYIGADFSGLCDYGDNLDPVCVGSRIGYVISAATCPVLWKILSVVEHSRLLATLERETSGPTCEAIGK